jgi:hypothetical protein
MDILWALLAFTGVMAVLSTVVTVSVEALHKVFILRRAGLEEMLRALHDRVLVRLANTPGVWVDEDDSDGPGNKLGKPSKGAVTFAKQMVESPSFAGHGRWWWLRNMPVIRWLFTRRFDRLSTLQFSEQLARTDVGKAMGDHDRDRMKQALSQAAYEFERYGAAQTDYFKRRAKTLSVLVAMVFAFTANVDAIHLFRTLMTEQGAADRVIGLMNTDEVQQQSVQAAAAADRMQALVTQLDANPNAALSPDTLAALKADANTLDSNISTLSSKIGEAKTATGSLAGLGLPIGRTAYPHCAAPDTGGDRAAEVAKPAGDTRCKASEASYIAPVSLGIANIQVQPPWRLFNFDGALWIIGVLGAGGLLGLGAPFWFDAFRRLAAIAMPLKAQQAAAMSTAPDGAPRQTQARDHGAADAETLTRGYEIAAGRPIGADAASGAPDTPPLGRRVGASSADSAQRPPPDPAPSPSGGAPLGGAPTPPPSDPMRQLRG